jgi:guanylate kinase
MVGPAGAGKNTVMREAIRTLPGLRQLPTATTRAMRPTEAEGREHFFISVPEFTTLRENGRLLEHQQVHGNWYGIARDPLEVALATGETMIADIDMYGAQAARANFPRNTVLIFVAPPSMPVLASRMQERGESEAEIARRMLRVQGEMAFAPECDYVIVNDSLEQATAALLNIIAWEKRQHEARLMAGSMATLQYWVRTLVLCGGEIAVSDSLRLPERSFSASETPHLAALDVVQRLGIVPPSSALTTFRAGETFLPPVLIDIESAQGLDRCYYYYVVRLGERAPLAAGWRWQAIDEAGLAQSLRLAVGDLAAV